MSDSSDNEMEALIDAFYSSADFNKPHKPYKLHSIKNIVPQVVKMKKSQTMEREQEGLEYVSSCTSKLSQSLTEVSLSC